MNIGKKRVTAIMAVFSLAALPVIAAREQRMRTNRVLFGKTDAGEPVYLYKLTNKGGLEARILDYGGIVVSLTIPDRNGRKADVVLGFDRLAEYIADNPYFGALIGRYGNRIAAGKFKLADREYVLACNNGPNHLHGGIRGFDKVIWKVVEEPLSDRSRLVLEHVSPDGDEGYPGTLTVRVTYSLTGGNELRIGYWAKTDRPTVVNLTHHSYFNLAGAGSGDILGHELMIAADRYTPVDAGLIPTGELRPVTDTPFDFRRSTPIGSRIGADDEQIRFGGGYDHNFALNRKGTGLELAARVYEPTSGRLMEVWTTEPGLQFYSGNFLDGHHLGKAAKPYGHRHGFCLETQHFPDSPNHPDFPSTVLRPEGVYTSSTMYRFLKK